MVSRYGNLSAAKDKKQSAIELDNWTWEEAGFALSQVGFEQRIYKGQKLNVSAIFIQLYIIVCFRVIGDKQVEKY